MSDSGPVPEHRGTIPIPFGFIPVLCGFIAEQSGLVQEQSGLAAFLRDDVLGRRLGMWGVRPRFRLSRLGESAVLRCEEERTGVRLALKSYTLKLTGVPGLPGSSDPQRVPVGLMHREWTNILRVRSLGLDRPPLRAVHAFATSAELGCLLVEEFVDGADLSALLGRVCEHDRDGDLDRGLTQLADFLARLHNASATGRPTGDREPLTYLDKVIRQLDERGVLRREERRELQRLRREWARSRALQDAGEVLIHGDATPTQFLFPPEKGLVVIDFERLHLADRAADLGRVAGELKHTITLHTADAWLSERYIQRFYEEYYHRAPKSGDYHALTERARFHMGCTELRIARNPWEGYGHRRWLVQEATRCLLR